MANTDILKEAFQAGVDAFHTVVANDKGIYNNPHNTYQKNSLPFKEFERGFNRAYTDQQKKIGVAGH